MACDNNAVTIFGCHVNNLSQYDVVNLSSAWGGGMTSVNKIYLESSKLNV